MLCVCVLLPLTVGCSIILVKSLTTPKTIIHEIIAHKGSILPGMPQLFRAFTDPLVPADLPLRLCISGSAPLPVATLRNFQNKFSFPLREGYGLSEASPVVSINPLNGIAKEGSIGLPIPNVEIKICDDNGTWLPVGKVGEICVRGGNVMIGYWKQPEATALALKDGWLRTGDVGYMDADGYTYITDRKKDMLLVNGNNVYSREIEEVLHAFPGIKEAAVIGIPDPRKGEQPLAYVSMIDGHALNEKDLNHFLRDRLADYKLPRKTVVLPALPRNATGKIMKTVLREMAASVSKQPGA
jgi:long-chain acyl-CoA synthetase